MGHENLERRRKRITKFEAGNATAGIDLLMKAHSYQAYQGPQQYLPNH